MKTSAIQIGKKYMLSLGRRGSVAVTVESKENAGLLFLCRQSNGWAHAATARRLSPCPVTDRDGKLLGYAHELNIG